MRDDRSDLVLEILKKVQADISEMKAGQRNLRQDVQALHGYLAAMHGDLNSKEGRISELESRVDRVERRLEIADD